MQNRGNGKGGGIAAVGLVPEQLGVSPRGARRATTCCRSRCSTRAATPNWSGSSSCRTSTSRSPTRQDHIDDYRDMPGLEVPPAGRPPLLRPGEARRARSVRQKQPAWRACRARELEDEFVYRNSFQLNDAFYASLGEKRAFVLSHGRDLLIFKIVGYAEQIVEYYQLEDFKAHVWIAHQRYPTKGRVWHPGGAHPFIGLNEALVHNGDFANYHSVSEYLRQRNIRQQFLTDTEVSVLLFDLWNRVYKYPLEYIIEALAPTTELDFDQLPPEKQAHLPADPGDAHPRARPTAPGSSSSPAASRTDAVPAAGHHRHGHAAAAGLRARDSGDVQIGLICSEKQAIDATLRSLAEEDPRFCPVADRTGTRAAAATPTAAPSSSPSPTTQRAACASPAPTSSAARSRSTAGSVRCDVPEGARRGRAGQCRRADQRRRAAARRCARQLVRAVRAGDLSRAGLPTTCARFCELRLAVPADTVAEPQGARPSKLLTLLHDRRYATGDKRRGHRHPACSRTTLDAAVRHRAPSSARHANAGLAPDRLGRPATVCARPQARRRRCWSSTPTDFPPEGDDCDAVLLREAYQLGWKRFIVYRLRGQRFHGLRAGPGHRRRAHRRLRLQRRLPGQRHRRPGDRTSTATPRTSSRQIIKRGKLVIYGDVGQTFMYGAKGGEVFVLGNAAGRPLINAVGRPRVVINGTCLDFLAESFMAGDPLNGGGFVILNGIEFDDDGGIVPQAAPYPGSNLFSLASGRRHLRPRPAPARWSRPAQRRRVLAA